MKILTSILSSLFIIQLSFSMASPFSMSLTAAMKDASNHLSNAILIALNINKGAVTEAAKAPAGSIIEKHTGKHGSLCFVVRRPG